MSSYLSMSKLYDDYWVDHTGAVIPKKPLKCKLCQVDVLVSPGLDELYNHWMLRHPASLDKIKDKVKSKVVLKPTVDEENIIKRKRYLEENSLYEPDED